MTELGFGKERRLLTATDYQSVFNGASFRVSRRQILILANENPSGKTRIGLVIAKKHVRLAVQRNRLKRLTRESFRHHQQLLNGLDIVMLARGGLDKLDNDAVTNMLEQLWQDLCKRRNHNARQ
ncbi:ribonuclease P protein component [Pseudohongiella nitratireducens]|jgi:ribonuclease P protein component|uniref:Ribonuclease P protein component n=1 Tax=Pseudohongiella nitratireducens TaxID=1768907 RepID=A0A917GWP6_9GAMM|nr:ribonuclease P protein component [Pseudohongiella nitratireducens]GGG58990.1 ribonuclease P protein component [Pseudohongiella nitratireducens]|tara:strand:+ start:79 stop:450 length:372 start_codon:yes stop_codon:yes gene_type:complete